MVWETMNKLPVTAKHNNMYLIGAKWFKSTKNIYKKVQLNVLVFNFYAHEYFFKQ